MNGTTSYAKRLAMLKSMLLFNTFKRAPFSRLIESSSNTPVINGRHIESRGSAQFRADGSDNYTPAVVNYILGEYQYDERMTESAVS